MLKWAVNGPRQSYLPTVGESSEVVVVHHHHRAGRRSLNALTEPTPNGAAGSGSSTDRRRLRRKSSDVSSLRRRLRSQDKENQLTSTPLPLSMRNCIDDSPSSRKLGSLKDLSNIAIVDADASPLRRTPAKRQRQRQPKCGPAVPAQYASTLPTFDVEYSPCGLVPGPILALRGIGIADTYFEKPRYLTHEFQELSRREEKPIPRPSSSSSLSSSSLSSSAATTAKQAHPKIVVVDEEASSLSSSRMGDMTLERMIDAILESARKDRKAPKQSKHSAACPPVMSPTYTPADDPASDLHEFWDAASEKYHQQRVAVAAAAAFNEREVRSPLNGRVRRQLDPDEARDFQLRRQRAVRRKRKMTALTASVKSSAQKMFGVGGRGAIHRGLDLGLGLGQLHYDLLKRREDVSGIVKTKTKTKTTRNISPDSGRNSSSDYEDSTLESAALSTKSLDALDATKRRLSFSINDLCEC